MNTTDISVPTLRLVIDGPSNPVVTVLALVVATSTKYLWANHGRFKGWKYFSPTSPVDVIVLIDKCSITIGCVPLLKVQMAMAPTSRGTKPRQSFIKAIRFRIRNQDNDVLVEVVAIITSPKNQEV